MLPATLETPLRKRCFFRRTSVVCSKECRLQGSCWPATVLVPRRPGRNVQDSRCFPIGMATGVVTFCSQVSEKPVHRRLPTAALVVASTSDLRKQTTPPIDTSFAYPVRNQRTVTDLLPVSGVDDPLVLPKALRKTSSVAVDRQYPRLPRIYVQQPDG